MVKSSLARGLQSCLGQSWKEDPFKDFVVIVEDTDFHCHRFILSACSSFFKCMFQSDLREKQDGCTTLREMSSETFDVIINAIYSGVDGLTKDNVIDVWHATHMLDIPFLVQECEEFACKNMCLDNYIVLYETAKLLESKYVINFALKFMKANYEHFVETETFLNVSFNIILSSIIDDYLEVTSENIVLESILTWINYEKQSFQNLKEIKTVVTDKDKEESQTSEISFDESCKSEQATTGFDAQFGSPNVNNSSNMKRVKVSTKQISRHAKRDRFLREETTEEEKKDQLVKLLSAARTTLATRDYLDKLMEHPLILSSPEAFKIIHDSLMSIWNSSSTNAIKDYRLSSSSRSVMAFVSKNEVKLFSFNDENIYSLGNISDHVIDTSCGIASLNSAFFYFYNEPNEIMSSNKRSWSTISRPRHILTKLNDSPTAPTTIVCQKDKDSNNNTLVPFHNSIFLLLCSECNISSIDSSSQLVTLKLTKVPKRAIVYEDNIIIIYNSVEVDCYNVTTKHFEQYTFDEISIDFVSFFKGKDLFILQGNGVLRKVDKNIRSKIELKVLTKLWDGDISLTGAAYFRNNLILFSKQKYKTEISPLPGLFENIRLITIVSETNLTPMVVPDSWLETNVE
ncbi:uncharacterized protein LOC131950986 [Physella acuta]|uniref:uncharacterized protein LOC131950986 n=1 Tax=Physella acuta TaxID=109671 RepID=UPI0027DB01C2|nr:uncharacterized protein LOC131950986 [Physella acuta]